MENFESIDSLAYEKAMLFSGLCPNGVVVVDKESCQAFPIIPHLAKEFGAIDVITVGKDADVQIVNSKVCNNATHVTVEAGGVTFEYAIQSVGAHFVLDSAIAFASAMCAAFDGTLKNIVHEHGEEIKNVFCPVMNNLKPIAGRGQTYMLALDDKREITVIDDAYNANLTSMLSGLRSFECASGKRRVAVIGDMLALGEMTTRAHEQLFEALAHSNIDKIYAVGMLVRPHFAKIPAHKQGRLASSREELEAILFHELQHGDVVWVKASNAVGLYGLFGDLTERVQADIAA
jgi:UDP-N-acetylmuramoyl-tripeptide--D-alanyl-D-alanine ligase